MSQPNLPPAGPEGSGTPPDKRQPPPPGTPAATPEESGQRKGPTLPRWARRVVSETSEVSPESGSGAGSDPAEGPRRSKPPPLSPGLRLATRFAAEPAEPGAQVRAARPTMPAASAPRSTIRTWVARLVMLMICAGSVGLVYWSLFARFQPVSRLQKEKVVEFSILANEVEQLRLKWNPAEVKQTRARFRAAQKLVFTGPAELSEWEKETARESVSMMLETALEVGSAVPHPLVGLNLESLRTDLYIRPIVPVGVTNSPYQQLLGFIRSVGNSTKRVDLLELSVDGDSNSVALARARLQFLSQAGGKSEP